MDRDAADEALARMGRQKDAVSDALLDLYDHPGRRFMEGAALTGATAGRWARADTLISTIWDWFGAYTGVLDAATELRARHPRPGQDTLAELSKLLTGPSVEIIGEEIPLERRGILQSARVHESLTPDQVIERMNSRYEEATAIIVEVDAAWSALTIRLAEVSEACHQAAAVAEPLGGHDRLADLQNRLQRLRAGIAADPLAFWRNGRADTAELDEVETTITSIRAELDRAATLRADFAGHLDAVEALIERVAALEAETAAEHDHVITRISAALVSAVPRLGPGLRDRLALLKAPPGRDRLIAVADELDLLRRDAGQALTGAETALNDVRKLIEWRDELRGRLGAYRAKAAGLGHSEDGALAALHQNAHDLLWQAPCDLREATAAVARYQRAVAGLARAP